jgi:protein-S-isoprenylcysteine O-methyltransferase Ste14
LTSVKHYRTPPAIAAATFTLIYGTVNVAAPLGLSTLTRHAGWNAGPGVANWLGIVILAAGVATIVWSAAAHARAWRERDWEVLKLDPRHLLTPAYLVTDGPSRFARNPLYVGDALMWAGWAVFLGSPAVAVGFVALVIGLQIGVRLEERGLARQFGTDWYRYAASTPRFLGIPRTSLKR